MSALHLRAAGDRDLADKLRHHPDVQLRIERYERGEKQRARRELLATALRLSTKSAPDVHRLVEECAQKLEVETPFELYVYPDTRFNYTLDNAREAEGQKLAKALASHVHNDAPTSPGLAPFVPLVPDLGK
jgi:hypothetical protein